MLSTLLSFAVAMQAPPWAPPELGEIKLNKSMINVYPNHSFIVAGATALGSPAQVDVVIEVLDNQGMVLTDAEVVTRPLSGTFSKRLQTPAGGWPTGHIKVRVTNALSGKTATDTIYVERYKLPEEEPEPKKPLDKPKKPQATKEK